VVQVRQGASLLQALEALVQVVLNIRGQRLIEALVQVVKVRQRPEFLLPKLTFIK
jgi:hypothetical protein